MKKLACLFLLMACIFVACQKTLDPAITNPLGVTFVQRSHSRPVNYLPDQFLTLNVSDGSIANTTFTSSGSQQSLIKQLASGPVHSRFAFECDMDTITGINGVTPTQLRVGIIKDAGNFAGCNYIPSTNQIQYISAVNGALDGSAPVTLPKAQLPKKILIATSGTMAKIVVTYADGTTFELPSAGVGNGIDLRQFKYFDGSYKYGVICVSQTSSSFKFKSFKGGMFGWLAIRDLRVMTDYSGNPIIKLNGLGQQEAYFTATFASFDSKGDIITCFNNACGGICKVNLTTYIVTPITSLSYSDNTSEYGCASFHVLYDQASGQYTIIQPRYELSTDNYGSNVSAQIFQTNQNLLGGGVFVLPLAGSFAKPLEPGVVYEADNAMYFKANTWYIASSYRVTTNTYANFRLDKSSDNFKTFQNVMAEPVANNVFEGFNLSIINNSTYFLCSGFYLVQARDPTTGALLYTIPQTIVEPNGPANHAAIFTDLNGTLTWLSFDGTNYPNEGFSYGDFYVFTAG